MMSSGRLFDAWFSGGDVSTKHTATRSSVSAVVISAFTRVWIHLTRDTLAVGSRPGYSGACLTCVLQRNKIA